MATVHYDNGEMEQFNGETMKELFGQLNEKVVELERVERINIYRIPHRFEGMHRCTVCGSVENDDIHTQEEI